MHRPALTLCSLAFVTALLAGCGGSDDDSSSEPVDEPSTAASSPSETASSSAAATDCTPPAQDLEFTAGSATLEVTAGPDQGSYDLALDTSDENMYAVSDMEITGTWLSADEKAVLFIDIEGVDPCTPDAFVSIGTQGAGGPLFVDSSHTACTVELPTLGDSGAEGTFTCTGLTGGGEGLERDAEGTFALTP